MARRDDAAEHMFSIIEQWKSCGVKRKEFCIQQGLSLSTFQYWLRKYNRHHEGSKKLSSKFVELVQASGHGTAPSIQIHTPAGYRIELPENASAEFIKSLIC